MEYILDSGAYSSYKIGAIIDIDEYCDFIRKYEKIIDYYIVLDVIGSDVKSYENLLYMQAKGLNPLPVFHQGDDFKYLEKFTDGSYDFICLSPLDYSGKGSNMVRWLDECFGNYICDNEGKPKMKVHGLGLTTPHMMNRYPWYSVDSTSWKLSAAFGSIFVPRKKLGKYDFIDCMTLSVSIKGDNKYNNLSDIEKEYIREYLLYMDVPFGNNDEEGVSNSYAYRRFINLLYTKKLEEQINEKEVIFKNKSKGLF